MGLKREVFELTQQAYFARRSENLASLEPELREILDAAVVACGGLGPFAFLMIRVGIKRMKSDCAFASRELRRACESYGVRAGPGSTLLADLYDAWDTLVPEGPSSITATIKEKCAALPNPAAAQNDVDRGLSEARLQGRALARADLAHFVAQRKGAWWGNVWRVAGWLGAVVVGGLITEGLHGLHVFGTAVPTRSVSEFARFHAYSCDSRILLQEHWRNRAHASLSSMNRIA
jgi:hypothetical protein